MPNFRQLRHFKSDELLLAEAETRAVLRFIFRATDYPVIDSLPMSDHLRGFAQALLLEAIDASFGVGFVEALWKATIDPAGDVKKIMRDFVKRAASHWFDHATTHDLQEIRVYQFVLDHLAHHFRKELMLWTSENSRNQTFIASLSYRAPTQGAVTIRS